MRDTSEGFPVLDMIVEAGVLRLPTLVRSDDGDPFRPRVCLWVEQRSGMVLHVQMAESPSEGIELLGRSLVELAKRLQGVPRQIQMRDPNLARELKEKLGANIDVVVRESLPMLDLAAEGLLDFKKVSGPREASLLDVPGMTLDHLIAFADAAKAFYQAQPWRHLTDNDLIHIESPAGPQGALFTQVLGAGGQTFGLGFVASLEAHQRMQAGEVVIPRGGMWSLFFGEIDHLSFADGEAFERHNLPIADSSAYPEFARISKSARKHPTPDQLLWAEGLLRALAATTEDEMDRGQWEMRVTTLSGQQTYRLSMPLLLEQMSGAGAGHPAGAMAFTRTMMERAMRAVAEHVKQHGRQDEAELKRVFERSMNEPPPAATTPAERALVLCDQARQARGRRELQLVRQALAIDPDCCEALLIRAERTSDVQAALSVYRDAFRAAEKQLGPETFNSAAGHFWGLIETRPYMRARAGLAVTLMSLDHFAEAAGHFADLLRLNPGDNQGNRYLLAQCLLLDDQLDRLDELLNRSAYHDDFSAEWAFTRALLAYRRQGDSPQVRQQLDRAQQINPYVAPLLTGRRVMPLSRPQAFAPGSEEEAAICVEQIDVAWHETPGAIEWLERATTPRKKQKPTDRNAKKRKFS